MIRGLSPFMRIMYCSGVWSYIVGAITTPLFIIIPLLTIWAGIFPIVISWWAALALTIYYIAQSMVLNYSKKVTSLILLLFATVNSVCWCIATCMHVTTHELA
jgi:endoglucanase